MRPEDRIIRAIRILHDGPNEGVRIYYSDGSEDVFWEEWNTPVVHRTDETDDCGSKGLCNTCAGFSVCRRTTKKVLKE